MNADTPTRTLLIKVFAKGVEELAIAGGVLFGIAGRVDWPAAWLILLLFVGHLVLSGWWLFRRDPELLKERLTTASNVPQWDRRIARANKVVLVSFLATTALDAGRFGWSDMPMSVRAIGIAAVVAAIAVSWWCGAANHFLAASSRIQSERGQTVVQHGVSIHPASAIRLAHCPHHRSGIDVRVVDRTDTGRLAWTPARTTDVVRRSPSHDRATRLSRICEARSRASRSGPVVTIGCPTCNHGLS